MNKNTNLEVVSVKISNLKRSEYYVRKQSKDAEENLTASISEFGLVDPILANNAPERMNIIIGGDFRLRMAEKMGYTEVPVIYITIADIEKEKELNLRLNQNVGEFDWELLGQFDEKFLTSVGFSSEEMDRAFPVEETPEEFDLNNELDKLGIEGANDIKTGDIFDLDGSRLLVGDSMIEEDMLKLMSGEKADMVMTDPPYILDYLKGKKKSNDTKGFGYKRDRTYIGTETLPDNFTELWMGNVAKVQKKDFSIIVYENWKNIPIIWSEMEKHWKIKNMLVWHLPNRVQNFAAKYKFFNKHDIAMVGTSEDEPVMNLEPEDELFQSEYDTALYAISGKPGWEEYGKGKKYCPTDFIECIAADEKSSGQGIIFGTKPIEILIPYIKVLTKRGDLVLEPFGGSGSTGIACTKLGRRFCMMEKCPIYAAVIINRWQKLTGKVAKKV